ncbi:hypothetical protein ACFTZB_01120 [Rhodococcus sp. NPDC057014]|uniref:hypothetical protein n=1 Tax=Rhodococcus sp. NPDC057014 TaxID=3346000 RepID=UPI003640A84F
MNLKHFFLAAVSISALVLTACGTEDTSPQTPTPAPSSVASSPASPTPPPAPPPSSEPVAVPAPPPVTFECGDLAVYQSGTALYSDGTVGYEAVCDTYVPPADPVLQYCDYGGVAVYTDGSSSTTDPACASTVDPGSGASGYPYDPSQDRNGDGVVNGYERCGLACGEDPTSGEIQLQYGCEQGYITGPQCN